MSLVTDIMQLTARSAARRDATIFADTLTVLVAGSLAFTTLTTGAAAAVVAALPLLAAASLALSQVDTQLPVKAVPAAAVAAISAALAGGAVGIGAVR